MVSGALFLAGWLAAPRRGIAGIVSSQPRQRHRVPGGKEGGCRACPCDLKQILFLSLQGLIIRALVCFITAKAHELYIAITVLEMCIVLFFIIIYILDIHHLLICLDWSLLDFLRCVTAALIYFAISITAVAKYSDGASKAAGVFGFFATIVFAIDFYLIFNDVAKFLKQGDSADENTADKAEEENSDSDSD
ncbi:cklf-like marvel transmembrane [Lynx pardinus]|uniref:Cklf-like marvel transmembrane n=1 Tax=Lynx pardinus TaxID=191816 RepID=A0A485N9U6_LYNPA|nr:cklf-like marvel transmembrane [Lynx pardinus]